MIEARLAPLRQTKPSEYAVRFVFGGLACVIAGLVARRFGPGVGGLFLAFPAIFPASATLIETHEKRKAGGSEQGIAKGRREAGTDAAGAAMGCLGLAAFGCVLWRMLPAHSPVLSIASATLAWAAASCGVWALTRAFSGGRRT